MRSILILPVLVTLWLACSCNNNEKNRKEKRRMSMVDPNACRLDSVRTIRFLEENQITDSLKTKILAFYRMRKFTSAWFNNTGLNEYAGNFVNLANNEKLTGNNLSTIKLSRLFEANRDILTDTHRACSDSLFHDLEVLLTLNFFEYAKRNWGGVIDDVSGQAGWFIVRKQIDFEQLLTDFLSSPQKKLQEEPVYRQYGLLREYLKKYSEPGIKENWQDLGDLSTINAGDTSIILKKLKKQLFILGDLRHNDSSLVFDSLLTEGIRNFQQRHCLKSDGQINKQTIAALRVPYEERVQQILINMERARWVPVKVKGNYVVVNIPQFKMHVYRDDSLQWSANVIVGKSNPVNKTIIFNDSIEYIVFSPTWNIPKNILMSEIMPQMKKNIKYLEKHNMEVIDREGRRIDESTLDWKKYTDHFPYIVREKPGENNSLGQVKFLFPNSHDIYIHDTPAKTLFGETYRTFSHGCIRLENPEKLARYLLGDDPAWPDEKIISLMKGGKESFVRLKHKVPVFLAYFTSWVDRAGRLNFAEDVYGHDGRMKELLFVN